MTRSFQKNKASPSLMLLPQDIVDAIIDCIGIPYTQALAQNSDYSPLHLFWPRLQLKRLALLSRACNHRVRSHLFANYRVCIPNSLEGFRSCPDVLVGYICTLIVFQSNKKGANTLPIITLPIITHFASSQLISIIFNLHIFPEELLGMLECSFPNISHIDIECPSLTPPPTLLNLVRALERVKELCLRRCKLDFTMEEDKSLQSLSSLLPLHSHLSIIDSDITIISQLSQIPFPLHSLSYTSRDFLLQKELINACARSLEKLEARMVFDCGEQCCLHNLQAHD